jgi:hypothetical protein
MSRALQLVQHATCGRSVPFGRCVYTLHRGSQRGEARPPGTPLENSWRVMTEVAACAHAARHSWIVRWVVTERARAERVTRSARNRIPVRLPMPFGSRPAVFYRFAAVTLRTSRTRFDSSIESSTKSCIVLHALDLVATRTTNVRFKFINIISYGIISSLCSSLLFTSSDMARLKHHTYRKKNGAGAPSCANAHTNLS